MGTADLQKMDKTREYRRVSGLLPCAGVCIALAAALVAVSAGFGSRVGLWHFRTGFDMLKWAVCGGLLAVALSVAGGFLALKQRRVKRFLFALLGLAVGGTAAAVPISWKLHAGRVPPIHDITTDIDRPPGFVAVLPLRKDVPNPSVRRGGGREQAAPGLSRHIDRDPQSPLRSGMQARAGRGPRNGVGYRGGSARRREDRGHGHHVLVRVQGRYRHKDHPGRSPFPARYPFGLARGKERRGFQCRKDQGVCATADRRGLRGRLDTPASRVIFSMSDKSVL